MISLFIAGLIGSVASQEILAEYNFNSYTGAGVAPGGAGGTLNSDGIRVVLGGPSTTVDYGATSMAGEVARGSVAFADRNMAGVVYDGGIGAIELNAAGNPALLLQATSKRFTPGYIEFRYEFDTVATTDTPAVATAIFEFWHRNSAPNLSSWKYAYATGSAASPANVTTVPAGFFATSSNTTQTSNMWTKQQLEFAFPITVKAGDTHFFSRFLGDDAEGFDGARDPIALDAVGMIVIKCENGDPLCPCDNNTCKMDGESCRSGLCRTACTNPMSEGCACGDMATCNAGLMCTPGTTSFNLCTTGGCLPGQPGCICTENGKCDGVPCLAGTAPRKCDVPQCPSGGILSECIAQCGSQAAVDPNQCSCTMGVRTIGCLSTMSPTSPTPGTATTQPDQPEPTDVAPSTQAWATTNADGTNADGTTITAAATTTAPTAPPATNPPLYDCSQHDASCDACFNQPECAWCGNKFGGACKLKLGLSCNFAPLQSIAECSPEEMTLEKATTLGPVATTAPPVETTGSAASDLTVCASIAVASTVLSLFL